jgi:hypothetical protein
MNGSDLTRPPRHIGSHSLGEFPLDVVRIDCGRPRGVGGMERAKRKAARRRPHRNCSRRHHAITRGALSFLRRNAAYPRPAKPTSIIAQVEGSGTTPAMSNSKAFLVELTVNEVKGSVSMMRNHLLSKVSDWWPAPFASPIDTRSSPVIVSEPRFNTRAVD